MWRNKGSAHDPNQISSSVEHGGGNVMVWQQIKVRSLQKYLVCQLTAKCIRSNLNTSKPSKDFRRNKIVGFN